MRANEVFVIYTLELNFAATSVIFLINPSVMWKEAKQFSKNQFFLKMKFYICS